VSDHVGDIASLLSKLKIKGANITGHSLGSFIAQGLAVNRPEYVSSITLIGSAATLEGNETLNWLLEGGDGFPGVNHVKEQLSDEFLTEWTASSNYDENFVRRTYEHAKGLPLYVWVNAVNGVSNSPDKLKDIHVPVQIIYGSEDAFFSRDDQLDLIKGLGSDYILFQVKEGSSHNTHWEGHLDVEIADDIVNFLKSLGAAVK
jgi:pimeloyl-ACP methyl ester carboxylesterase